MQGMIYSFNGIYGFATDADGEVYFVHKENFHGTEVEQKHIKRQLSKARRSRNVEISFTPAPPEGEGAAGGPRTLS